MSEKYLPLFRKYRPQSFKDVVGQESLVKALSNAIELNKIANAYLFSGPRGTGKTSSARIFAKSLNCINGPTLEPCQKCPSCLDITNASGLDVIEIDAATNRGIDDAKELIAQAQYAPMNGKYKIFIIDEVHMLSNEAFNALLKTFEEPPNNVIFILATTEPHKVIETIVSRCQRFDLRRITTDDITKRLREVSDIENIKITDDALYTIAKNVSGGLRDSLALLDQVSILGAKEEITKEVIENMLGKMTFDVSLNFLNIILSKDTQRAISYIDEIYNKGLEPKNFCENFIEFLRNLIFVLSSDEEKSSLKFTNFNLCDIEKIKALNLDSEKVFRILNKVIEYYKEIRYTTNPYLWTELLIINLCKIDETVNIQQKTVHVVQNTAPLNVKLSEIVSNEGSIYNETPAAEKTLEEHSQVPSANKLQEQSVVRETLKEIHIPNKALVEEKPKNNEPEHLMEYKENLYETKQSEYARIEDKKPSLDDKTLTKTELPRVPGVDDIDDIPSFESVSNAKTSTPANIQQAANLDVDPNPAVSWANVLSAIESIPAKFFFSGVGKLIKIENKRIVLGFVNENVINQAKSDSKSKHLDKAVKNILGADYSFEFILMTPDIKPIDVKLKAKIQPAAPQRNYQNSTNSSALQAQTASPPLPSNELNVSKEDVEREMLADMEASGDVSNNTSVEEVMPVEEIQTAKKDNDEKAVSKDISAAYGKKTQEMLEAFNGKVIE